MNVDTFISKAFANFSSLAVVVLLKCLRLDKLVSRMPICLASHKLVSPFIANATSIDLHTFIGCLLIFQMNLHIIAIVFIVQVEYIGRLAEW